MAMSYTILMIFLITLIPSLELRASIPYGIVMGVNWLIVFLVATLSNILLAGLVWFFIKYIMHFFLGIHFVKKLYDKFVIKSQKKLKPYLDKYGMLGLALFIGAPLPGSGVYTGGLGAFLLGYKFKDYLIASIIGVIIAGALVTIIVLSGNSALQIFTKSI